MAVFLVAAARTSNGILFDGQASLIVAIQNLTNTNWRAYSGIALDASPAVVPTAPAVVVGIFNGASGSISINGVKTTGDTGATGFTGITIGAGGSGAANWSDCDIYEIVIYNVALTDAQRQQVEGYLANKYGISAAVRTFDPLAIPGCKGWWRVDGGCDVNTDAAAIGTLYDRSGNSNHLVEATNKPTYETNELNAFAIARFDGVNDKLTAAFTLVQPTTLFLVAKQRSTPGANEVWCDGSTGLNSFFIGADLIPRQYGGTSLLGALINTTAFNVFAAVFNAGSSKFRQEGVVTGSGAAGAGNPGGFTLGCDFGFANFADVDVAEAIFYSGVLSDQNIASITAYLTARYAIGYKAPNHSSLSANLKGWWDSSREIYANNDPVTQLTDRSTNGRNLVTGTSPDFKTLIQNGRPSVLFTAINLDFLTNAAFTDLDGLAVASFFSVTKAFTGGVLFGPNGVKLQVEILAGNLVVTASVGNTGTVAITGANPNIVSVIYNGGGAANADRLKVWVNGIAQTLTFAGTIPATLGTATGLDVGRSWGVAPYAGVDAQEIALFNTNLSDADRRAVENYLAQKYDITV